MALQLDRRIGDNGWRWSLLLEHVVGSIGPLNTVDTKDDDNDMQDQVDGGGTRGSSVHEWSHG
jgi:hypothetical protein